MCRCRSDACLSVLVTARNGPRVLPCSTWPRRPWRRGARREPAPEGGGGSGAVNAGTVRNRTMQVGQDVVPPHPLPMEPPNAPQPAEAVVVGLDGGYVRSRHRQEERHFEVIAGRVFNAGGDQSRFAFVRNDSTKALDAFKQALAVAGVQPDTPATVLCDGDTGLWRLQREALPGATVVLDWWHAAVRFEHALQAARGLGAGTARHICRRCGGSWLGAGEMALVARPLAGMPAQARGAPPLDTATALS